MVQAGSELQCWAGARSCCRVWRGFAGPEGSAGARGPAQGGDHEPSPLHSPGSTASHVQLHPLAASVRSRLMRQPCAERIRDRDEDPVALPSLGELLFAFIVVASSMNPTGLGGLDCSRLHPQHHQGGCRGASRFPHPARRGPAAPRGSGTCFPPGNEPASCLYNFSKTTCLVTVPMSERLGGCSAGRVVPTIRM